MKTVNKNTPLWLALLNVVRHMGWFAAIGLAGAVLLAKLFEELAESIFRKQSARLDDQVGLTVHSLASPQLDKIFKFFTDIGDPFSSVALTLFGFGALVWRKHPHAAWLLVLANGGGLVINLILKSFFRRPRPELWQSNESRPSSYSFPSGHATLALCFYGWWGWLGYKFITNPLVLVGWLGLMLSFIFMIGLSRIYRGVHYLSDVVGGYISGSFWLALLLSGVSIYDRLHPAEQEQTIF